MAPINWGTFERNRYYSVTSPTLIRREHFNAASGRIFTYTLPAMASLQRQDGTSSTFPSSLDARRRRTPELYTNPSRGPRRITLPGSRIDLEETRATDSVGLEPYGSIVLLP
ncbi:MAG: hypothetical protein IPK60_25720 [Sandaracinaceae bacterium]|nr:hypothetical protein [Sandaracinaceae bacterium]